MSSVRAPMPGLLSGYQKGWVRSDAVAGLTTAAVVIPQSMAYASIAGLPVHAGLYVALVPMFVYALLGTSRPLSVSSTSTLAILTATELTLVVPNADPAHLMAAASSLALLVGGFLILAGLLRLGFLANFISDPVLDRLQSRHRPRHCRGSGAKTPRRAHRRRTFLAEDFFHLRARTGNEPRDAHSGYRHGRDPARHETLSTAVSGSAVAVRWVYRSRGIFGAEGTRCRELTGSIPAGIPSPAIPDLMLLPKLWPGALGMALMSFTESIAAGRAFARHDDPPPVPNRELLALGAANLAGSFFKGFPAGGGTSQTAVNSRAGARTQVSELVTVFTVAATLLFLSPLISLLPQATLAAVVVVTTAPLLSHGALSVHSGSETYGVPVGDRGLRRRSASRYASGHLGRGRYFGIDALLSGQPSAGLRRETQAGHRRLPPAVRRTPGR